MTRRQYLGRLAVWVAAVGLVCGVAGYVASSYVGGPYAWLTVEVPLWAGSVWLGWYLSVRWARSYYAAKPLPPTGLIFDGEGKVVQVHPPEVCKGEACCLHNPSAHHMVGWPLVWRGQPTGMVRVCPHDIDHPDPDALAFRRRALGGASASSYALHACDGCCREAGAIVL